MTPGAPFPVVRFITAISLFLTGVLPAATTSPSTAPVLTRTFQSRSAGIRFQYPAGWPSKKGATSLLEVVDTDLPKGNASLTLDVPNLPPFFSGLISPKMVENGYVKDLRKNQIHDAKVDESVELKLPACSARRVICSGHENSQIAIDVAVLIVHAGRVYIFSCDSDDAGYSSARAALDDAVASIEWIK